MYQKIAIAVLLLCSYVLPASAGNNSDLTTDDLHAVVATAKTWKGTPYRYGGKDKSGVDCSHFVYSVYNRAVLILIAPNRPMLAIRSTFLVLMARRLMSVFSLTWNRKSLSVLKAALE
jgi:NlpC/P60 family